MSTSWRASRGTEGGAAHQGLCVAVEGQPPPPRLQGACGPQPAPSSLGPAQPPPRCMGVDGLGSLTASGTPSPLRSLWPLACPRGCTWGPRQPPLRTCPYIAWRMVAPEPPRTILGCDQRQGRDECEDTVPSPILQSPVFGGRTTVMAGRGLLSGQGYSCRTVPGTLGAAALRLQ